MNTRIDPLTLMNAIVRFTPEQGVPVMDERWLKKIAALCEYAAALNTLLAIRTEQYRARCRGTVRDTKLEGELIAAASEVERIEKFIGAPT